MTTSQRLNETISLVLRIGMMVSLATLLIGLIWYSISPVPEVVIPAEKLIEQLAAGNPIALLEIGIMILIATPFLRLLTSLAGFIYERDAKFVVISLFVIGVVTLSILIKV